MKHHSIEEKLEAIRLVEEGNTARFVSEKLHLGNHQLYDWLAIYRLKGKAGLINYRQKYKKDFSFEEKSRIILEYQESVLTLPEFAAQYGISSSTLWNWQDKVSKKGIDALKLKRRPKKEHTNITMKRLPKEEYEKENERLRKENERLRAENLLLKKVRALVKEREAQDRRIGRGLSKN